VHQDPESPVISRHFVNVPGRQVHFRLAGSGPPLLLLHQSPASSAEMATELAAFADRFTVIAPDTPGFGLSDSLPEITGANGPDLTPYAEALGVFLSALGIEKILIYGFHTGAMLGFEFARLYPERCAVAIVNGLVVCEPAELADLLEHYNVMPALTPEGAHLPWMWARMRDQTIFFPWYRKTPAARMDFDVPDPVHTHIRLVDFLTAQEGGRAAYQAAFAYPTRDRIHEVEAPVFLLNYVQDPLSPHPERLAEIPRAISREIFANPAGLSERVDEILSQHATQAAPISCQSIIDMLVPAAGDPAFALTDDFTSAIVNTDVGPVYVRCSRPARDEVVVWLHDAGSSSQSLEPLARNLINHRQSVLIDLPGHGETGALHLAEYSAERLAQLVLDVVGALGSSPVTVIAQGAAGSIATAMVRADNGAAVVRNVLLIDPWVFDPAEHEQMAHDYVPDLTPQAFGEHLLTAWYFARDSELFWPWHAALTANALARTPEISAAETQARSVDLIKAGPGFSRLVHDLLAYDLPGSLAAIAASDGSRVRLAARRGNGHEARARSAAERVGAECLVLPERLADWMPELEKCLG
jgi:pimeloyl-ACP methyl ester carboxylesterase